MKIKLKFQAVVEYNMSMELTETLIRTSKSHYDGRCRAIGNSGGILVMIKNMLQTHEVSEMFIKFQRCDCDILAKLCEMKAHLDQGERRQLIKFERDMICLMDILDDSRNEPTITSYIVNADLSTTISTVDGDKEIGHTLRNFIGNKVAS